jgi:hypothetical protein
MYVCMYVCMYVRMYMYVFMYYVGTYNSGHITPIQIGPKNMNINKYRNVTLPVYLNGCDSSSLILRETIF